MVKRYWIYPDGTRHATLPRTWQNVSGIRAGNAHRYGFQPRLEKVDDPVEVHTYSKLRLYDALVAAGIWEDVKTVIEGAGQWDRWELANVLSTDYQPFASMLDGLRQRFGEQTVDRILASAEVR